MLELSVARAGVDTATRHADGRRVTSVQLRVGHLRQVVPESLAFYFEHVARGTPCEGARLEQEVVPAVLACDDCRYEWELDAAAVRALRDDEALETVPALLTALYAEYAREAGKPRFADKTPRNVLHVGLIARSIPESRFVHLVRDGRDGHPDLV